MERNGPYHSVPGNDYHHDKHRGSLGTQDRLYPDSTTPDPGYPNTNNSNQDRTYPQDAAHDRMYNSHSPQERNYAPNQPTYPEMEMKNLQDRNERNKNRELPEKPKTHQETNKEPEKKEEDLRWGPRLKSHSEVTTVHGVRQIWEPSSFRFRRIIWVLIVLTGLILFIKQLVDSILFYRTFPVAVDVKINYNDTLLFPAITMCNINSFRASVAARQGRYDMISHLFTMQDSRDPMSFFTGEEGNLTMEEIYLESAHNKHDLIVDCLWDQQECSADDFEEVLTDHGVCYRFNGASNGSALRVYHTGADRGLRLRLNIEQYEYMTGPNEGAGLKILVHAQHQFPLVRDLGQAVPPGAHAFVGIQMLQVHNLKEPYGKCEDTIDLEFFDSYSLSSCYINCKQKYLLEQCGCREFYMPAGLFMEEETRVCMMTEYVQCVRPALAIFEQEERKKLCKCPIPCDRSLFDPIITYAANSNFDMDKVIQNNFEDLQDRYHSAREITQKVNPSTVRRDRRLIKDLGDVIRDIDDTFADIDRNLKAAVEELAQREEELRERVSLHRDVALRGVEHTVEHHFVRVWDLMEERTLDSLKSGFYEVLHSMDRFLQQQTVSGDGSGDVSQGRDVLWLIIDADLANRLEIIQRARANISKVNTAFEMGKPIVNLRYIEDNRYERSFVPTDVLHHDEQKRKFYFKEIMSAIDEYVENVNTLRDIGKTYANDGKLDNTEYREAKKRFIHAAKGVNHRILQYRDKIVLKSLEIVREKISDFVSSNDTLKTDSDNLKYLVDGTTSSVNNQRTTRWQRMRKAGFQCNAYMLDFNASKTDLAQYLNSARIQEDLIKLDNFFSILRGRATRVLDQWVKTEQSFRNLWRSMITETTTKDFYTILNNDTKLLINDPENNTETILPIFADLLKVEVEVLNGTNATEFLHMLNADIPDTSLDSKMQEVDEMFDRLKKQSDVVRYIRDRDEAFLTVMRTLQNSLRQFIMRNELSFDFYRENFLHLDIFMRELSFEEITQQEAYTLTNLWSDIGGSLALFLGASAITVFELLDVFLHHAAKRRARTVKQRKAEKEKERANDPQSVPLKRAPHKMDTPFDDELFYHPPHPHHQYAEPEYSEIPRPRQKRPHSKHNPDRPRSGSRRGGPSRHKNYDAPAAYQLQPDRHNRRRRSRSKSPRDYYQ